MQPQNPLHRGLTELGWIEGRTFVFECVSTLGRLDQLAALARELVSRRPDVLTAGTNPLIEALKQETTTIPIVMNVAVDPVQAGIITNLARPEANVTGVASFGYDILPKRIELLKEIVPHLRRLGIITLVVTDPKADKVLEENLTIAASRFGFAWQIFRAVAANDYDRIFADLAADHFDVAYIGAGVLASPNGAHVSELALNHLMPTVAEGAGWAKRGILLSYGQNFYRQLAHAAAYVDKILRGAKPSELPVEQEAKLELGINLKTAKALGLTVPPELIARADEVIE
jgi:putative ABC transport system substrate-binding protein